MVKLHQVVIFTTTKYTMTSNKGIHFEISERKILLRVFDVLAVLIGLYVIGYTFEFDYFTVTKENWTWSLVLALYITLIGTVFELYDLQKSSKLDTVFKNIVLTASITVLLAEASYSSQKTNACSNKES